jgi:hypothetical protein
MWLAHVEMEPGPSNRTQGNGSQRCCQHSMLALSRLPNQMPVMQKSSPKRNGSSSGAESELEPPEVDTLKHN